MSSDLLTEPLPRFIVQLGLVVLCSRLLGLVTRRIGQPAVIAEIAAGILLGPSLFGLVAPEAYRLVFAPESLKVLGLVSQLGLVLFMFLVGLELDPSKLRSKTRAAVAISNASIALPFGLGVLLAYSLRERFEETNAPPLAFALFMGSAMSITAFPVLARILREQRLLTTTVGSLALTCAAIDDVSAWCILAFVVAVARAGGVESAVLTTALAAVFIGVMFWLVRPLLERVGARISERRALTQDAVAVTMLLLFASSLVSELIGIHALFGAFLFGVILPKTGSFAHALSEKIGELTLVILLPLFFAYSGIRTQIGLLNSVESLMPMLLVLGVACLGKFGGATLAARLTGSDWREASAIGVLMNTRGLMELIVLNIGLDLGVIGPKLFTMMVLMALTTTFIATPLIRWFYPPELMARELAGPLPERSSTEAPFAVLVCVADARVGPSLLTLTLALSHQGGARIHALSLKRPHESAVIAEHADEPGQPSLAPLLERAVELGVAVEPLGFSSIDPALDIAHVAETKRAELILLGSHKPVIGQSLLGGTVYRVMRSTPRELGVLIDRGLVQVRRVLLPFLGSAQDFPAMALCRRMLADATVHLTVLHVTDAARNAGSPIGAEAAVAANFAEPGGGQVEFRVVTTESPADTVLAEARAGYDLLVVAMSRDFGLEERAFGVQRERLLGECPISVLVVRPEKNAAV